MEKEVGKRNFTLFFCSPKNIPLYLNPFITYISFLFSKGICGYYFKMFFLFIDKKRYFKKGLLLESYFKTKIHPIKHIQFQDLFQFFVTKFRTLFKGLFDLKSTYVK